MLEAQATASVLATGFGLVVMLVIGVAAFIVGALLLWLALLPKPKKLK